MPIKLESKDLDKVIMIGDRILVKPTSLNDKTKSGLYLPPTVVENEQIQQGYVVKTGPGYPIPALHDADESWKNQEDVKYIPLQVHVGDLVVFVMNGSHEIHFNNQKYFILTNNSILMIVRDEGLLA
jgi:co-chaperonin GroES (HSP10)